MKKLLAVIVLGVIFTSCNNQVINNNKYMTVTECIKIDKGYCYKITDDSPEGFDFYSDSLYLVGDTLKIGKK